MSGELKFLPSSGSRLPYDTAMYTQEMTLRVDAASYGGVTLYAVDNRISTSVSFEPSIARLLAAELIAAADAAEVARGRRAA